MFPSIDDFETPFVRESVKLVKCVPYMLLLSSCIDIIRSCCFVILWILQLIGGPTTCHGFGFPLIWVNLTNGGINIIIVKKENNGIHTFNFISRNSHWFQKHCQLSFPIFKNFFDGCFSHFFVFLSDKLEATVEIYNLRFCDG